MDAEEASDLPALKYMKKKEVQSAPVSQMHTV